MEKVLFCYKTILKELDKTALAKFLAEKSATNFSGHMWYHRDSKTYYHGLDDFLLKNLNQTTCIQVYIDRVVRLRLKHEHYETPKSIFFDDYEFCNDERNISILEELVTFSNYN